MGQQQITGAFAGSSLSPGGPKCNVSDSPLNSTSTFTGGSTLINSITVQPPLTQQWKLVGWTITFSGNIQYGIPPPNPYGRLGALYGAVLPRSTNLVDSFSGTGVNPMSPLPQDAVSIGLMWDGAIDPPFPAFAVPQVFVPLTHSEQLPIPLAVLPGDQLSIGMWLTPSLVSNVLLLVLNATYSLIVDDGQGG